MYMASASLGSIWMLCEREPEKWGNWEKWWQDEDTRLVHFIGKDNIVFHCIIFPVMMKAHGKYITRSLPLATGLYGSTSIW